MRFDVFGQLHDSIRWVVVCICFPFLVRECSGPYWLALEAWCWPRPAQCRIWATLGKLESYTPKTRFLRHYFEWKTDAAVLDLVNLPSGHLGEPLGSAGSSVEITYAVGRTSFYETSDNLNLYGYAKLTLWWIWCYHDVSGGHPAPHGQHARMDRGAGIRAGLVLALLLCFRPAEERLNVF